MLYGRGHFMVSSTLVAQKNRVCAFAQSSLATVKDCALVCEQTDFARPRKLHESARGLGRATDRCGSGGPDGGLDLSEPPRSGVS